MNIASISRTISSFSFNKKNNKFSSNPSFKSIYVDEITKLGPVAERTKLPKFQKKDALLLNEIAQLYPNQDCFIKSGRGGYPILEYREKPPEVQIFSSKLSGMYKTVIDPKDKEFQSVPLILHKGSDLNRFIGMTSYFSLNPSLPFTIKVGFELHKKLLAEKEKILEELGRGDDVNLGDSSVLDKAYHAIRGVESAVILYLLHCANSALSNRATGSQLYETDFPKVQTRLDAKRKLDLTTSISEQPVIDVKKFMSDGENDDICEKAVKAFPNHDENIKMIDALSKQMAKQGLYFV